MDEPNSDHFFLTGANLEERERTELIQFLKANIEVFAWTPYDALDRPKLHQTLVESPA